MKFKTAVEQTAEIKDAYCSGLQALRNVDKKHVSARDSSRLTGSVDIDSRVEKKYPNDPRWDYAIGHLPVNLKPGDEIVYWIEIHPASDGEVNVVIGQLKWLKQWLKEKAPKLNAMRREFIWLSSGKTSFTLSSPQQKQFALLGPQHKGRVFKMPDEAPA